MEEKYNPKRTPVENWIEWVESVSIAVAVVILLFVFVAKPANVQGSSMVPTLADGEKILITDLFYTPSNGDIVVIDSYNNYKITLVKRVIATQGDEIDIDFKTGDVFINKEKIDEPYIFAPTTTKWDVEFPLVVPENKVFVMGDNRPGSKDSRNSEVGFVDVRDVMGKAFLRLSPATKIGIIK